MGIGSTTGPGAGLRLFSNRYRKTSADIPQQPLDIVELELRAVAFAEAATQLVEDFFGAAAGREALRIVGVEAGVGQRRIIPAPAQRPAERIGLLLRARLPQPPGLAGAGPIALLLLHRLRQALRAAA